MDSIKTGWVWIALGAFAAFGIGLAVFYSPPPNQGLDLPSSSFQSVEPPIAFWSNSNLPPNVTVDVMVDCYPTPSGADGEICSSKRLSELNDNVGFAFRRLLWKIPGAEREKTAQAQAEWVRGHAAACFQKAGRSASDGVAERCMIQRFAARDKAIDEVEAKARAAIPTYIILNAGDEAMSAFAGRIASTAIEIVGPKIEGEIFPRQGNVLAFGPIASQAAAEHLCDLFYWREIECTTRSEFWSYEGVPIEPVVRYVLAAMPGASAPVIPAVTSVASFDCKTSKTALQRLICSDRETGALDRAVARTYNAALSTLSGAARDHLVRDQIQWVAGTELVCTKLPSAQRKGEGLLCLGERLGHRLQQLKAISNQPYSFVSEGVIAEPRRKKRPERGDVISPYLQFEIPGLPTPTINRALLQRAKEFAANGKQPSVVFSWDDISETTFELSFVTPELVSILVRTRVSSSRDSGGISQRSVIHADLKNDHLTNLWQVFDDDWKMAVVSDLYRQYQVRAANDEWNAGPFVGGLLAELDDDERFLLTPDGVTVMFAQGEAGPMSANEVEFEVPYSALQANIGSHGLLASKLIPPKN